MHYHGEEERQYTGAPDEEVCECLGVQRRVITGVVEGGARTLSAIGDTCDAGLGCGECHLELARILLRHRGVEIEPPAGARARERVEGLLAPLATELGAPLCLVEEDEGELRLSFEGDDDARQTVALFAELLIEPLLPEDTVLSVE